MESVGIKKNELEEFKRTLISKINSTLSDSESEKITHQSSLDIIPGAVLSKRLKQNDLRNGLSENKSISGSGIASLRLTRAKHWQGNLQSNQSGYLFMAIMFCMMCCSSLMTSPSNTIKLVSMTQNTLAKTLTGFDGGRKLLFAQGGQQQ